MNNLERPLFEDEWLIAFDKPAGLLVAPDRWDSNPHNMVQMVRERTSPACFNLHGLDREASGAVLFAKAKAPLKTAKSSSVSDRITTEYTAIVRGTPPSDDDGFVDFLIAADPHWPGRMRTLSSHGTPAETRYHVVERWRGFALLNVIPVTNVMHQIRVHLAEIGAPIIADATYGDGFGLALSEIKPKYKRKDVAEKPLLSTLALHSSKLSFDHPATGAPSVITSDLPDKFEIALKYLRRFA